MLRKTVVAHALSIAFSATALSLAVVSPAMAQSNAAGTLYGKVAPGSATAVVIQNLDTNQRRTVTIDAGGQFSASALAIGRYRATLQGGSMDGKTADVDVLAGQGVEAVFGDAVAKVEVTGRRNRIDMSTAVNGATFTARELSKLPVARNVDAIIQLAPNTTRSDPTYIAGASIGGGAPSENSYYINGMPVTNPLSQLGASELPFGAVAQAEIQTGGYGSEFGRSVGGVVNIVGKSGTNNWEVGVLGTITPKSLREDQKDTHWASTAGALAGQVRHALADEWNDQHQFGGYVGGPLVKDKLFMFAAVEQNKVEQGLVNQFSNASASALANTGFLERDTKVLRFYGKLDWNITDNHRLEYTNIGDRSKIDTRRYSYDYNTRQRGSEVKSTVRQEQPGTAAAPNGGDIQILRYTGNLTDDLTVTALAGKMKTTHIEEPGGYDPTLPGVTATSENRAPGLNYNTSQLFSGNRLAKSGATDDVDFKRADIEYKLGQHTLRAGIDKIEVSSLDAGEVTAGGFTWVYGRTNDPSRPFSVVGGQVPALAGRGALADQGYYVSRDVYIGASDAYAEQEAWYLEDKWQLTKDLHVTFGVRNESFRNMNSERVAYLEQKNIVQPRASFVWDMRGDSTVKVYGSVGRYSVPMPTVVALRAANGATNTDQYYTYTGTDANGQPTGLQELTPPISVNQEFGQPRDPRTVAALNMDPSIQDEITLGFEQAYSPSLNFGAKVTYRALKTTIDDFCDGRPFRRYALRNNIAMAGEADWDPEHATYPYFSCASFNPGEDQEFMIDYGQNGQYTRVKLSAAELGFEKPKRVYQALDLFVEHPYRNGWYGRLNYTWSRNTGNTEGQTLSDLNNGQADVAATTTWDYYELMRHANGLLPNDRTHQIKAFGFYDLTPQWTVGANLTIESGRPKGCLGADPNPQDDADWQQVGQAPNYGVEHYCFGSPDYRTNRPAPRGSMGRLPWQKTLDLNVVYRPTILKGLALRADVFNVFNTQTIRKYNEQFNNAAGTVSVNYGSVSRYTAPRAIRLSAEFNHKF